MAVGALDPGVPYESRWAPYVRIHGPGQGQFPKGSIRPRGYMAPDARHSLARTNVTMMRPNRQRLIPSPGGGASARIARCETGWGDGLSPAAVSDWLDFRVSRPIQLHIDPFEYSCQVTGDL